MQPVKFKNHCLRTSDEKCLQLHRMNQRMRASVHCNHYISSAYTGYRWKGDYIKMFFETIVYTFRTDPISLKRIVQFPVKIYEYNSPEDCLRHHSVICKKIIKKAQIAELSKNCSSDSSFEAI